MGFIFISYSSSVHKGTLKSLALVSFGAGTIWYIGKNLFVYYVVYNKTYASVYGSFLLFYSFYLDLYFLDYLSFGLKLYYFLNHNHNEGNKIAKIQRKARYLNRTEIKEAIR